MQSLGSVGKACTPGVHFLFFIKLCNNCTDLPFVLIEFKLFGKITFEIVFQSNSDFKKMQNITVKQFLCPKTSVASVASSQLLNTFSVC